jgi:signal peptidase II
MKYWIVFVAALVAADQAAKALVEKHLPLGQAMDLLPILALYRTHNTGIAFSMLSFAGGGALVALTLVIMTLVLALFLRTPAERVLTRAGLATVLAGAIGNLIDRLRFGHVVDFVLVHWQSWSFAIFNLADAAITVGALMVAVDELRALAGGKSRGMPE